ncbi:uncharacterized protein CG4449 [Anopheles maculipalpis]|uniref:uncharacterized protein CG4449 n=1 Tax=Anopheles maculipalpis TaxID=1496333 RepID=UPI002158D87C|nr:uncharacterized protein CG4449 [Anopheles maculipalpis]
MSDIFGNLDNFLENYDENNLSSISGLSDAGIVDANETLDGDRFGKQNTSSDTKNIPTARRSRGAGRRSSQPNKGNSGDASSGTDSTACSVVPSVVPASSHTVIDLVSNVTVEEEMQSLSTLFQSIYNSKNPVVEVLLKDGNAPHIKRGFTMLKNSYNRKPPVTANDVKKIRKKIDSVRNNLNQLDQTIKSVIGSTKEHQAPSRSSRRTKNTTGTTQAPITISLDCDDDSAAIPSSVFPYNRRVTRRSTAANALTKINIDLDDDDSLLCCDDYPERANNSFETENYEIRVKVKWGQGIETFVHRRFQKFADIIAQLATKESADSACIFLNLDDRIVHPHDTPDSISYKSHQFISGRILRNKAPLLPSATASSATTNNTITLKVQMATRKQPLLFQMEKSQTMSVLVIKCAEELQCEPKDIKLYFDGELVENSYNPKDLDLEGGEVLDICFVR